MVDVEKNKKSANILIEIDSSCMLESAKYAEAMHLRTICCPVSPLGE